MKIKEAEEALKQSFQDVDDFIFGVMEEEYTALTKAEFTLVYSVYVRAFNEMLDLGYTDVEIQEIIISSGSKYVGEIREQMNEWVKDKMDVLESCDGTLN